MCGIVGFYSYNKDYNVVSDLIKSLMDLQHRGQLSAGITTYNKNRKRILQTYKENGKVDEVFRVNHRYKLDKIKENYSGNIGIGHSRYATSGDDSDTLAQPFERPHGRLNKWFSIAYNGNLSNFDQLKNDLEKIGYNMTYDSDTEIIMHYISRYIQKNNPKEDLDFVEILKSLNTVFDGAWNLSFVNAEGNFFASRDVDGFHPLCYGFKDDLLVVASESCVLSNLQMESYDIPPGNVLVANDKEFYVKEYAKPIKINHCFFEYIYFSRPDSILNGKTAYEYRKNFGQQLAKEDKIEADLVVPVPDSGNAAALGYAEEKGLKFDLGLIRNHYVGRTFIEPSQQIRSLGVKLKLNPNISVIKDKRIILVDDSLVRGTTSSKIVKMLYDSGAKEVHVRIASPEIKFPDFYGVDTPTKKELLAANKSTAEICEFIKAKSLKFLSLNGLYLGMGFEKRNENYPQLTDHHFTGEYPVKIIDELGEDKVTQLSLLSTASNN